MVYHIFSHGGRCHAVTSGIEGWSDHHEVRFHLIHGFLELSQGWLGVLIDIVISADEGSNDFSRTAKFLLKAHGWSDRAVFQYRSKVRLIFAADLAKELVNIV
ncbi:hypothetical protein SDC9_117425 [bioreactor metagenome]|uniref:Uncharacterized protein n=1 Tax=bioreactor metagenome TaxID=1076179 RepID=A0A645BY89_9ZZZZ